MGPAELGRPKAGALVLPARELLSWYRALFESGSFSSSTNLLGDLRDTDSSPRTRDTLGHFASIVELRSEDAEVAPKIAVVAPRDLSFGLARMYEAFADSIPWKLAIFRSAEDALAWLGSPYTGSGRDRGRRDAEPGPQARIRISAGDERALDSCDVLPALVA
jgi:hypothetical protein